MREFEAIVFDLGGTLIEYAGEHETWPELEIPGLKAAHAYLLSEEIPVPSSEAFSQAGYVLLPERWRLATLGERNLTVSDFLAEILADFSIGKPEDPVLQEGARRYESAVCSGAQPVPHSKEVLAQLKEEGYKLGLISNTMFSGRAHMADLERFDMARYFDSKLFSADADAWKPNLAPFQQLLDELDVKPEKALFVGDDPRADVIGGRRAGMFVVHFVSSDRFPSPDGVKPDATIHNLPELFHLLEQFAESEAS